MYYRECPRCGCTLDPGERCDCLEEKKEKENRLAELMESDRFGQLTMKVEVMRCRNLNY